MVALVNLQGGGGQHLAGVIGGTDLLAAEAHDTGIAVHNLLPAQVADLFCAEGLNALVIQVDVRQLANGAALGLKGKIDGSKEEVDMLGIGEIRQEGQDRANG